MSVRVERVTYRYPGAKAGVFGVDLEIADGELVACIGPSGSGKTTLLRLIAGFLRPDEGRVLVAGVDVTGLRPRERDLGIVFQSYALFPHMTVAENVAYPLALRKMPPAERRKVALDALARMGLDQFADRRPATLSGGQQQRVALARALAFRPKALLLDEPLSALDAALRVTMRDEIRRIQKAQGIAALHITHDQEEALSIADRVAVLDAGRILQVAPPRELYDAPASRAVAAFVGHSNLWPARVTAEDAVQAAIGPIRTARHGFPAGREVFVLVRPERIVVGPPPGAPNRFTGRLARDRFLGATRRFDFEVEGGIIQGETGARGEIAAVQIPPEAVQLLPE
ncbi:MAG TPA: ABC transporter ATP-binding protein [Thermodesulfobacteriota bacterium]